MNFALNKKDIHGSDIIFSVELSLQNLSKEEQNEFRYSVNMLLSRKPNIKMNVTQQEQKALKSLLGNLKLITRRADKGSGIVLLNTLDYGKKMGTF